MSEIVALDLDDLRLSPPGNRLLVRASDRCGATDRQVPIHDNFLPQLQEWLAIRRVWPGADDSPALLLGRGGRRVSGRAVYDAVARVGAEAGLGLDHGGEPLSPQVLRNTLAKWLLDQEMPVAVVAALLGHRSLDTTQLRATPSQAALTAAMGRAQP